VYNLALSEAKASDYESNIAATDVETASPVILTLGQNGRLHHGSGATEHLLTLDRRCNKGSIMALTSFF
jgi:hypothetical protein